MMLLWKILVFLLMFVNIGATSTTKCQSNENCVCEQNEHELELKCSPFIDDNGEENYSILITADTDVVIIDCFLNSDLSIVPEQNFGSVTKISMRDCLLTAEEFDEIFNRLNVSATYLELVGITFNDKLMNGVKEIANDFRSISIRESFTVSFGVFENATGLKDLIFSEVTFLDDTFTNTELTSLEISSSELTEVPTTITLPKLKALTLFGNRITHLRRGDFELFYSLVLLELSENNIKIIEKDSLSSLVNLKYLHLKSNKIASISKCLFERNYNLIEINLNENLGMHLADDVFSYMLSLKAVSISGCHLKRIPKHFFRGSSNLESIDLSNNSLEDLPVELFQHLSKLSILVLSNNRLSVLNDSIFLSLRSLNRLELQNNSITRITSSLFNPMNALRELDISFNKIAAIELGICNEELKIVNMSHNVYHYNDARSMFPFINCVNLEEIYLAYNLIVLFPEDFMQRVHLKTIDLSNNIIEKISMIEFWTISPHPVSINLDNNKISHVDFTMVEKFALFEYKTDVRLPSVEVSIENNPISCGCDSIDLIRYVHDEVYSLDWIIRLKLDYVICWEQQTPLSNVDPQSIFCGLQNNCTRGGECECLRRPYDDAMVVNCVAKRLTELPQLSEGLAQNHDKIEVHLEQNALTRGPTEADVGYHYVTALYLNDNNISELTWLPKNLGILQLHNNQLQHIKDAAIMFLNESKIENLTLEENPWNCDCETTRLASFLRRFDYVRTEDIRCFLTGDLLIDMTEDSLCSDDTLWFNVIVPCLIVFCVASSLAAIFYRYQLEIKVWLFFHNMCLYFLTEDELDSDKLFDAFISYSHKDESFVLKNLVSVLENSPENYKLCLHYKSWIPGEFISEQIARSVAESRRTVVVLSNSFLKSVWGKMEFRTAHTQALKERRTRVIIVLIEDIDENLLDEELKAYMKTNTYIKWGDPWFWNKMKYALPHNPRHLPIALIQKDLIVI